MYAQDLHPLGQRRVVRDAHARVPEGAEILCGKEGETAHIAKAARPPAIRVLGADGLRGILDDA